MGLYWLWVVPMLVSILYIYSRDSYSAYTSPHPIFPKHWSKSKKLTIGISAAISVVLYSAIFLYGLFDIFQYAFDVRKHSPLIIQGVLIISALLFILFVLVGSYLTGFHRMKSTITALIATVATIFLFASPVYLFNLVLSFGLDHPLVGSILLAFSGIAPVLILSLVFYYLFFK